MANKFRINGSTVSCPDPATATWEPMNLMDLSISGRGVQQGNYRVTLTWDVMDDASFSALMTKWIASQADGYRITSAVVPPYRGNNNANWDTISGGIEGYILFREPRGQRTILQVNSVTVVLEGVARP